MKRVIFTCIAIIGFAISSNAQTISKNALGLRIGDSDGFGTEVSYQRGIGDNNRLEFDLGWRSNNNFDAYRLTALYQWVWVLDGNFNWYVGAGGGVAQVNFEDNFPGFNDDTETYFYGAGDIGIEYNFNIPLLLSLDFRPEFGFGEFNDDFDLDIALGIRYQF